MSEVSLRPALPEDAHVGGRAVYAAGPRLYQHLFARDEASSVRLLRDLWPLPGHLLSHTWATVAELNGRVAGTLLGYTGRQERRAVGHTLRALIRLIRLPGLFRVVPGAIDMLALSPSPGPDTFYVAALAVEPWARQRGVGRRLLRGAEELAREWGCTHCALDVVVGNEPAANLYRQEGYDVVETHRSERVARATGIQGSRRMVKLLR